MSIDQFKNILRVGLFKEFDYASQVAVIQMLDRTGGSGVERCPMSLGTWGIHAVPQKNSKVLIGYGYREIPYIVAFLPSSAFSQDLSSSINTTNISVTDIQYPRLSAGEVAIQGLRNSQLLFKKSGDVSLTFGKSEVTFNYNNTYAANTNNYYIDTEAGRTVSGTIKRDLRKVVSTTNKTIDKLTSITYDGFLTEIGKHPKRRVAVVTNDLKGANEILRNPALVEERHITYEFARSYMIGSADEEKQRVFADNSNRLFLNQPDRRDQVRNDLLNLNNVFRNNLIEEIRGTLVDRYGNLLDINRNIIDYTSSIVESDMKNRDVRTNLEDLFLRRSIKYHFELNARKDAAAIQSSFTAPLGPDVKNGYEHSKWFIDVDGEGLTKINIPASSNAGNIPVLTRYLNTSLESNDLTDSFRDPNGTDVTHLAFGSNGGLSVAGNYLPTKVSKVTTAYHDITTTASRIVSPIMATSISNRQGSANAGGKSAHLNLDGSLELNVGRDFVDHKSIVLDTSGSVISRIGKDFKNNSLVSQLDGNIAIQVGGDTISNGTNTESPVQSPTVKVYVRTTNGNFDKIEITETAIIIESAPNKNLVLRSGNNIILDAKGNTLISGEGIDFFAKPGNSIAADGSSYEAERHMSRSGVGVP